jgi:Glycosyl hydrolase family 76
MISFRAVHPPRASLRHAIHLTALAARPCLPAACACLLAAYALLAPSPAGASHAMNVPGPSGLAHSAAVSSGRPALHPAHSATSATRQTCPAKNRPKSKPTKPTRTNSKRSRSRCKRKPVLHGDPARALVAFEAMQKRYHIPGSGLYEGEPFSYLWPFSQALAATVTLSNMTGTARIPGLKALLRGELHSRLLGLESYLDTDNSGEPEGTFTSTLAAYDGEVAPPAGPGGTKYYDDNEWVGIELVRVYELTHSTSALGGAEAILAFVMGGWEEDPSLACPGGVRFSNLAEHAERNTVSNAPAAELAVGLYRITHDPAYLQFAEQAYRWVRRCLLSANGLYADHIGANGAINETEWSYNQGSMIGAGALLFQATHNGAYLWQARQTAKLALAQYTPERLARENPFFVSVYLRDMLYLDSITHDPPGPKLAQPYVDYAWQHLRAAGNLFLFGSPPAETLLTQAAIAQIYGLLSSPPSTYF